MEGCSAIVLAGGRARRLGGINKAFVDVGGRPVIERAVEAVSRIASQVIVVGRQSFPIDLPGTEFTADAYEDGSALVGLYSGLSRARYDAAIAVACDMPFLSTPLLSLILDRAQGVDLAVPRIGPHLEALHAVYRRSCLPAMRHTIEAGNHKIIDFYSLVRVREVTEAEVRAIDPDLRSVININTPSDLERVLAISLQTGQDS